MAFPITVKSHSIYKKKSIFIIHPSESLCWNLWQRGYLSPFSWTDRRPYINEYIVVSNGEKQFIQKELPLEPAIKIKDKWKHIPSCKKRNATERMSISSQMPNQ